MMVRSGPTLTLFLLAAANLAAQGGSSRAIHFSRYLNARFAYGVDYPDGLLLPQGEADNGDGQVFASKDGRASLRVWGTNNRDGTNLAHSYRSEVDEPGRKVTYKVIGKDWFVVSGREGDDLFYIKTVARKGEYLSLMFRYRASLRRVYDPIVAHVVASFDVTRVRTTVE